MRDESELEFHKRVKESLEKHRARVAAEKFAHRFNEARGNALVEIPSSVKKPSRWIMSDLTREMLSDLAFWVAVLVIVGGSFWLGFLLGKSRGVAETRARWDLLPAGAEVFDESPSDGAHAVTFDKAEGEEMARQWAINARRIGGGT